MQHSIDISPWALSAFYLLLLLPLWLFQRWQLGLSKTVVNSILRMTVQLCVVGMYLHSLFSWDHFAINALWLTIMLLVASHTICQRAKVNIVRTFPAVLCGLLVALVITLPTVLIGVIHVSPWWQAQYMIPIAGMLLGNALSSNVLALARWSQQLREQHADYQFYLAMGAKDPAKPFIRQSMLTALTPQLASMTTLGIVSLPGMMTGQILGGAAPLVAVKYQLLIVVAFFLSNVLSVAISLSLVKRRSFGPYGDIL